MASADPHAARFAGWRVALRVARRDALRSRGRSALVIVMIGLPVLLSTAIAVLTSTLSLDPVESLPRLLGSTQAELVDVGRQPIYQDPLATTTGPVDEQAPVEPGEPWTPTELGRLAGGQVVTVRQGATAVVVPQGRAQVQAVETDADPALLRGKVDLLVGDNPRATDQVLVSRALQDRGFDVGDPIRVGPDARAATVVGIARFADSPRVAALLARPGLLAPAALSQTQLLLNRPDPVTWDDVLTLNRSGIQVLSCEVVLNPPPTDRVDARTRGSGSGSADRTVAVIVVTSVLIEVVLLAGPAFAVGVRRQQRQLALLAAIGADRAQLRRTVLAGGLVLGVGASGLGAGLGLLVAVAAVQITNHYRDGTFGPLDVTWWAVAAAAALGTVAALAAAVVPARQASRLDVVAALTGRRAEARPARGWPLAGVLLAGVGTAITLVLGTRSGGETMVAIGTIVAVLGLVAVMPWLVGQVGRLARRLPVPLRIAVRDASRHRSRTAPAVAAVMGVVAGMTALAIGGTSDALESRRLYTPELAMGATQLFLGAGSPATSITAAAQRVLPGSRWLTTGSPGSGYDATGGAAQTTVAALPAGCTAEQVIRPVTETDNRCSYWQVDAALTGPNSSTGAVNGLVAPVEALAALRYALSPQQLAVLRRGGVLVSNPKLLRPDGTVELIRYRADGTGGSGLKQQVVPASYLMPPKRQTDFLGYGLIATPQTMDRLDLPWVPDHAVLGSGEKVTAQQEKDLTEAVRVADLNASAYTERGYRDELRVAFLILGLAATIAVLIGTLTATGLALADARPDLATLAAIGASPRSRRVMAGAHALVIGLLGTATGTALGFLPGIAVTYPLTSQNGHGPFLAVPWTMLLTVALVVPVFAAAVAAISHRTRQPLTRRV